MAVPAGTGPSMVEARLVAVTREPLSVEVHLAAVEDRRCGAVATFIGRIRDHDPGVSGAVVGIEYSAHPDAERVLTAIVADLGRGTDGEVAGEAASGAGSGGGPLGRALVAVSHRVGPLVVGDVALVACVATEHRAQAYEVSRALVERIKVELPVWKKQLTANGEHHWVGL